MKLSPKSCDVCGNTVALFDRQPVDDQHEVLFVKCASSAQQVISRIPVARTQ